MFNKFAQQTKEKHTAIRFKVASYFCGDYCKKH